jgi:hypothetical protein
MSRADVTETQGRRPSGWRQALDPLSLDGTWCVSDDEIVTRVGLYWYASTSVTRLHVSNDAAIKTRIFVVVTAPNVI